MEQKSKKKYFIAALTVLLVAVAVGGTIAWLNSASHLTNSFTVGDINEPTTEPGKPDNPISPDNPNLDGNLYEPNWDPDNAEIVPGTDVTKDPYVGIGKGSEDAYVFVYVKNSTMSAEGTEAADAPYFSLGNSWVATQSTVAGQETANTYTSGLFMYSTSSTEATKLTASETQDSWTAEPLFEKVTTPKGAEASDFAEKPTIEVYSYVIVANSADEALQAASAWANHPTGPTTTVEP